jgi:thiamine-phosphate pyrophosphorylase
MDSAGTGPRRRARLAEARLYLVCPSAPANGAPRPAHALPELMCAAIAGGVDIVQLREKHLPDEELLTLASSARALCEPLDALLIVNDRPHIARDARADGVHVGQDDMPVAEVRELVGPDMLIGLSTHRREEIDAVDPGLVDYIGVGPVHETPTKPGRAPVGAQLVRYAAAHSPVPFFAIGGLDGSNLAEVLDAGATRACVLRAVSDAADPAAAARSLRSAIAARATEG